MQFRHRNQQQNEHFQRLTTFIQIDSMKLLEEILLLKINKDITLKIF